MSGETRRSRGGVFPARRGEPLPMEYFASPRPPAGREVMGIDLSGLRLEIEGLDGALAGSLRARYAPYSDDGRANAGALRVRFAREEREYYIDPPERLEFNPVFIACDGPRVRFLGYRLAGWFEPDGGAGEILLARGTYEPELRALENYIRAAVAWRAASRGGALVHAASAVCNGRGYLFFGESGAGKSTLASVDRRGRVVSDDLSLLLPREGGGLDLVGSPFRGTYDGGAPVEGRFPLAAGFRLIQGAEAEVLEVPHIKAFGQLVGNLTFVAEAFGERPDLFERIERAFAGIPLRHLRFRKDDSYWDAIDRAGLGS